jgi:hypothetical protein
MGGSELQALVARLTAGAASPAERAVRLHDFVRDLRFGFTAFFDAAPPLRTVKSDRWGMPCLQMLCAAHRHAVEASSLRAATVRCITRQPDPSVFPASLRGHCNPKATLFVELLREAGFEARICAVNIRADVLAGCFPEGAAPAAVTHTLTEVRVPPQERWIRLDSYTVDRCGAEGASKLVHWNAAGRPTRSARQTGAGMPAVEALCGCCVLSSRL